MYPSTDTMFIVKVDKCTVKSSRNKNKHYYSLEVDVSLYSKATFTIYAIDIIKSRTLLLVNHLCMFCI